MNLTEEHIEALLDNALPPEEERRVVQALKNHPGLMQRYMQLRQQKKLLKLWWASEKEKSH